MVAIPVPFCPLAATPELTTVNVPEPRAVIENVPLLAGSVIPVITIFMPTRRGEREPEIKL